MSRIHLLKHISRLIQVQIGLRRWSPGHEAKNVKFQACKIRTPLSNDRSLCTDYRTTVGIKQQDLCIGAAVPLAYKNYTREASKLMRHHEKQE